MFIGIRDTPSKRRTVRNDETDNHVKARVLNMICDNDITSALDM